LSPANQTLSIKNVQPFQGGSMLYNMESFWTGMCPFQTLHKCYFYAATFCLV